jgi:hypothetical protein
VLSVAARSLQGAWNGGWRANVCQVGVVAAVAVAAGFVVVKVPEAVAKLGRKADRSSSLNYDDREFAAGNDVFPDKRLMYEARALIPPSQTYRVVTGSEPIARAGPLALKYAGTFATYFLMPRRPSPAARWILCFGCDSRALRPRATTVWTASAGSSILRVESR